MHTIIPDTLEEGWEGSRFEASPHRMVVRCHFKIIPATQDAEGSQ